MLHDYFEAGHVVVYRLVDDSRGRRRVQQRMIIDRYGHEHGPQFQPLGELPRLLDKPHWYEYDVTLDVVHDKASPDATVGTVFPLPGEFATVGLIEIEPAPDRSSLQPRDVRLIGAVLRLLSNHLAVLDYSERDSLTGLLNRKSFDQNFDNLHLQILSNQFRCLRWRALPGDCWI